MINDKKCIAIIPARGGSVGLPGKNIREICGKPLITWTIEKAQKSHYLDEIIVSTDSQEIADVASAYGCPVPFLRPAELATGTATTLSVIEHTLDYIDSKIKSSFDYTVLLEPTSPLREDDDIDRMINALEQNSDRFDAIVSLGEVGEHPSIMKRIKEGKVYPFCWELAQTTRRQDNEPAWFPYGVAYIAKTKVLLQEKTFYTKRCMGYPIKRYQNYEIDCIYDFICIESVMKYEWGL